MLELGPETGEGLCSGPNTMGSRTMCSRTKGFDSLLPSPGPKGSHAAVGPTWANRGNGGNLIKFDHFLIFYKNLVGCL